MHLANLTTAGIKRFFGLVLFTITYSFATAQDNSPYSRYGIGDLVPNQNIVNRGMGGIAIGYTNPNLSDHKEVTPAYFFQSINLVNPASLGSINNTIFDIGGEVDIRTLKSTTSPDKYTSTNTIISYLQVGFPIASAKMKRKGNSWGVTFGLRPVSKVSYKIEKYSRIALPPSSDTLYTLYEGSGGINQVNIGTGVKIKNLSFGINGGYSFGNKTYSTKLSFLNDSVIYYKSNSETKSSFGGLFLDAGVQYLFKLKSGVLNIGAYANLQQNLRTKSDHLDETVAYDADGATINIDTVSYLQDAKSKLIIPATYGVGFTYTNNHWLFGMDFETTNWNAYRQFGKTDAVRNNWTIRAGVQYYPAKENTQVNKYWNFVKYRAGFYFGPDYIKLADTRNAYAFTGGASFPLTSLQRMRYGEYVVLNTGFEFGSRGNKQTLSVRENISRISIGISMNARWFQKRSYD